jgi:DNA-binding response OmpR family regulator
MRKILIIEDDAAILSGLSENLRQQHYEVETAADGEEGFRKARKRNADLILLDLMLPKMNGEEVCRSLREEGVNTPILILTSRKEEANKVLGLELGADDYVTKPFSLLELQARIKAILRRGTSSVEKVNEFSFGNVRVDFRTHDVFKKGKNVKVTEREFKLLKFMIEHKGEVITRDMLLDKVWGYDCFPTTRTIDNYILSLRHKIEDNPSRPSFILTVHTAGYKFSC